MKRTLTALLLALALILSLAACGGGGESGPYTISGVEDRTVTAGEEFDALAGVTATDANGKDVTDKLVIEAFPELDFVGGKAVPPQAGSYELVYSLTDKDGEVTEAYATLTVTKATSAAVLYKSFDFAKAQEIDTHGWEAEIADGVKATGEAKQGAFVFDITDAGSGDQDIRLVKSGLALKKANYKVKVWAKSTADTYCHILALDGNSKNLGGTFNAKIGKDVAPLELNFASPGAGSAELTVNLGKITPNPDNAADTTPSNFTVTIDKVEIYEITGEEHEVPSYKGDATVSVTAGDGASATATASGSTVSIDAYPTDGGVWSIKADIALPGVSVTAGTKYFYSFDVKTDKAQSGECLVESAAQADKQRANFNGLSLAAGETKTVTNIFVAESDVDDPVIRLQIGDPADGAAANTLTFSNLRFGAMEGNLESVKTLDTFMPFGKESPNATNADFPWLTFNGTDEDAEQGVGTIWAEGGSLFYRIDQGGSVDWHNKLVCGYTDNPLTLAADSYYTVTITGKATKPVSCSFFLNPLGSWDPRLSEGIDFTTTEQTWTFTTTDTFVTDMGFEMLFQFGSQATAELGEVTVEISDIHIDQMSVR